MEKPRGWYRRGHLPHIDAGERPQFVTWRLADSIPARLVEGWRQEFSPLTPSHRKRAMARAVEAHLDQGHGSCLLRNRVAGRIVQDALVFYHGKRYQLHAWVVMPNHVHMLFTQFAGQELGKIVQCVKAFTSRQIGKESGLSGRLWQPDYFDRLVRHN